jgi:adenylate kinase family enzyme
MAPIFHLVCGSTGAGKTTYSLALAQRLNAVRFSIDEWMVGLFAKDKPEPMQFAWVVERVERCEDQIGRLATQCASAAWHRCSTFHSFAPAIARILHRLRSNRDFPSRCIFSTCRPRRDGIA